MKHGQDSRVVRGGGSRAERAATGHGVEHTVGGHAATQNHAAATASQRPDLELLANLANSYQRMFRPLCHRVGLPQTAVDILLFFANNPAYKTAKDVVEVRGIRASLVSINVEKLVREGYLARVSSTEDRRVVLLHCTEKAGGILEEGQALQQRYKDSLFAGLSEDEKARFARVLQTMGENARAMMQGC